MGGCSSNLRARVIPGSIREMGRIKWDATDEPGYIELNGRPLKHFVETLGLPNKEAERRLINSILEGGKCPDDRRSLPLWSKGMQCTAARVEVLSWNVGSLADGRSSRGAGIDGAMREDARRLLAGALGCGRGQSCDVIVVGLQEVISLSVDNAVAGAPRSSLDCLLHHGWPETVVQWVELLRDAVNSCVDQDGAARSCHGDQLYVLFGQPIYLFGMLLCVFCLPELVGTHINQFSVFEMAADRHESGVKGVVACRFSLYDRSFCFINCHFHADTSSGDEHSRRDLEQRMQQIQHCLRSMEFRLNDQLLHPLSAHRAIFLLGDTNMRLSRPPEFESWGSFQEHVMQSVKAGQWGQLSKHDQLRRVLDDPVHGLPLFREPAPAGEGPAFPPTYKLAVPGPGYSSRRVPAWTDRVLFRSTDVRPVRYDSVRQEDVLQPPRNITDHDPVYALFEVDCVRINKGVLQRHVQEALHREQSEFCGRGLQHLPEEQERHFRWRFVNTGRPHIESLAQRVFDVLKQELHGPELALAADKIIHAQQRCWRLVCDRLEDQLHEATRLPHTQPAEQLLEQQLELLSHDLNEAIPWHAEAGREDSRASARWPSASQRSASQPPRPSASQRSTSRTLWRRLEGALCCAPCCILPRHGAHRRPGRNPDRPAAKDSLPPWIGSRSGQLSAASRLLQDTRRNDDG